jgi:phosphate transport system protein
MKINSNLERIGDIAEGICQFVLNIKLEPEKELLEKTRIVEMFNTGSSILEDVMNAFEKEDTRLARSVFKNDEILDEININSTQAVADFIRANPDRINQSLYTLSIIRKLERVGDQCKNISEEIIFYIEAKVLKHKPRAQKQQMNDDEN